MIAIKDNDNNIRRGYIDATDIQLLDIENKFKHKNLEDALKEVGSGTEQNMLRIEDKVDKLEEDKTNILNTIGDLNALSTEVKTDLVSALNESLGITRQLSNPNLLINGDFQVWQRGTNFNVANNRFIYTSDRWCGISNFQNSTIKKDGEYIKFEINEVGNGDDFNILQGLESMNVIPLRNRKVTLSLDIKKYSNMLSGDIAINIYCGTGTDELLANTNRVAFDKVISYSELSETPKRFNLSTELPNNVSSLCVVIRCGSRYGNKPNNGASFGVKNVKLELGSVATPFVPRSYGEELALCKRYYETISGDNTVYGFTSSGDVEAWSTLKYTQKRVSPTVIYGNIGQGGDTRGWINYEGGILAGQNIVVITATNSFECRFKPTPEALNRIGLDKVYLITGYFEVDAEIY